MQDPRSASLADYARRAFEARVRVWAPRLAGPLHALYGPDAAAPLTERLLQAVRLAVASRRPSLLALDADRQTDRGWFQDTHQIGYVAYAELFGPTLHDVGQRVDYLAELGVTYFHLMKVLAARPEPNDGGFAVADYRAIEPALGSMADLERLADELHTRGISLCIDLVMNHTAREHEWAVRARAGDARYRDYYLVYPDRAEPDAYEATLPEVFPEMAPGNFTWDDDLDGWVWTTFNTYQWDLNYRNPDVLVEMLEVMLFLANAGVDVLRLDAVAFTWKRLGTNCQNQPEAHLIVQVLRALMEIAAPGVILKAEAIVGPRELTAYLGSHERERAECHVAYHNQLMVMMWSALASGDARLATEAMAALAPTPTGTGWVTYVRCHDDIGWAVHDDDAARVGLAGPAHRRFLAEWYRGDFPGSFARGEAFSANADTGDERTCGMTAALCGITDAERSRDSVALDYGLRRLRLAYGMAASFGTPLVYMGDEIALPSDTSYRDDPLRADDSRWAQRPTMDWDRAAERMVPGTVAHLAFSALHGVLDARRRTPPMRQGGTVTILHVDDPRVFAFARSHPEHGRVLGLVNVSTSTASAPVETLAWAGVSEGAPEVLGTTGIERSAGRIQLPALTMAWFTDDLEPRVVPSPPPPDLG